MKKLFALLLAATMLLSLCACGSSSKPKELEDISDEDWEAAAEALEDMYEDELVVETEATEKIYELGETIIAADGLIEIKFDGFQYADMVDYHKYVPTTENGVKPEEGKVFLFYTGTVNCSGDIKEKLYVVLDKVELDYNDGYKFKGTRTSDFYFPVENGNNVEFEPLSDDYTRTFTGYMEVPIAVQNDKENPILLSFKLWGSSVDAYYTIKLQ